MLLWVPMTDDLRARLFAEIHRVDWKPLAPHAKRGGLVIVAPEVEAWRGEAEERFTALILQPYVLVQRDAFGTGVA
jgi:hypothetical protein